MRTQGPGGREDIFIVEANRGQLEKIARRIDPGAIRAVVGAVFLLARARQAHDHKPVHGKVFLRRTDGLDGRPPIPGSKG